MSTADSELELVKRAREANARDWPVAFHLSAELRERFPSNQIGYQIGAAAARALRRFDEASVILDEAEERFPDQAWILFDQTWLAHARGDATRAQQLATVLRSRFPANYIGYQIGVAAARTLRQLDELSEILAEAAQRFPDQEWVATDQLRLANARGETERTGQLAADLRNRFPENQAGYQIGAAVARTLRQSDEAGAILAEAALRFADQAWIVTDQAWLAHGQGDSARARQLAEILRERFPENPVGYQIGAAAARALRELDEARSILEQAARRFSDQAWVAIDRARLASASGDRDQAGQLAADLRERFPDNPVGYQLGADAARALQQFEEAGVILAEAARRFSDQAWVTIDQARLANVRGESESARRLSADLRSRFPNDQVGYQIGSAAARALGRFDDASAILETAAQRFPDQAWVAADQARIANARGDYEQARQLAAALRSAFPDNHAGYQIGAAAARTRLEFEKAEAILDAASQRFGDQEWIATEQAWLAQTRGDLNQACDLGANLRRQFPDNQAGYQVGAISATGLRQFEEASAILADAAQRFTDIAWVTADQARVAFARGDMEVALERTAALRNQHPTNPLGYQLGVSLLRGKNRLAEADALLEQAKPLFSAEPWFASQCAEIKNLTANRADAARLIETLGAARARPSRDARDTTRETSTVVVIVGMHRAGTSLCAKIVDRLGFTLGGPLLAPSFDNLDGFREHREISTNQEALLSHLGATWDTNWAVRGSVDEGLRSPQARLILDRMKSTVVNALESSGGRWAFKDPRTACFLPQWTDIFDSLGIAPKWLLAVRDPRAVAASLFARNRIPHEIGQLLWAEHYLNALRHLGPRITCVAHYEKWFSARDQLFAVSGALGVEAGDLIEYASQSINDELKHNVPREEDNLLGVAGEVYSWLSQDVVQCGVLQAQAARVWSDLEANGRLSSRPGQS